MEFENMEPKMATCPFSCNMIKAIAIDHIMLEDHIRIHHLNNYKPFECAICKRKFSVHAMAEAHVISKHAGNDELKLIRIATSEYSEYHEKLSTILTKVAELSLKGKQTDATRLLLLTTFTKSAKNQVQIIKKKATEAREAKAIVSTSGAQSIDDDAFVSPQLLVPKKKEEAKKPALPIVATTTIHATNVKEIKEKLSKNEPNAPTKDHTKKLKHLDVFQQCCQKIDSSVATIACKLCKKQLNTAHFARTGLLHIFSHSKKNLYRCQECNESFRLTTSAGRHISSTHSDKRHKGGFMNFIADNRYELDDYLSDLIQQCI